MFSTSSSTNTSSSSSSSNIQAEVSTGKKRKLSGEGLKNKKLKSEKQQGDADNQNKINELTQALADKEQQLEEQKKLTEKYRRESAVKTITLNLNTNAIASLRQELQREREAFENHKKTHEEENRQIAVTFALYQSQANDSYVQNHNAQLQILTLNQAIKELTKKETESRYARLNLLSQNTSLQAQVETIKREAALLKGERDSLKHILETRPAATPTPRIEVNFSNSSNSNLTLFSSSTALAIMHKPTALRTEQNSSPSAFAKPKTS